ncbi:MAG TPA: formate--tetrahydrofolate ligase [Natrialbaceae archaeon]|nr:formate--tetrahydrofolate ligase [Natrialbaceae archaeon]
MSSEPETDYEIAQSVEKQPIWEITEPFGVDKDDLELYGDYKAKLSQEKIDELVEGDEEDGNLVLVTGMTPTPLGEGKTVTTVGLGQAFNRIGKDTMIAVREPSLGPVFGIKGGAAGGGWSQVLPMEDINLHFTGDIHALTAAHNLISAMLDAHISKGNELNIDTKNVQWQRAVDMNDRALRNTIVGVGESSGTTREDGHLLTAASELMAILCLADSLEDLKERIGRIIVAYDEDGDPVTAGDIEADGPTAILLRDALRPNLVQTIEGTPALVHGGPFANIAHGTNSLIADKVGLKMGDYLITEAGFGSDLGGEKFYDVVCQLGDISPDATVIVGSIRALKYHGKDMWPFDKEELEGEDVEAVKAGLANLDQHVKNLQQFGVPVVVAINKFPEDTEAELDAVLEHYEDEMGVRAAVSRVFEDGGEGGVELAEKVVDAVENDEADFEPLYDLEDSLKDKMETVAKNIYGADGVNYVGSAEEDIAQLEEMGLDDVPVVMSKTFHSLSDDASKKGVPEGWELDVRELYPSAGAGFVVALTGDVMTMPGLPARPAAADMDIDADGNISGLF